MLDASAVLAFINRADRHHDEVRKALLTEQNMLIIPVGILAEIGYLVEARLGQHVLALFLKNVEADNFVLDCGIDQLERVRELIVKCKDLPLGYADAAVIACAERFGKRVASLDRRDFEVVGRELNLTLLP